MEALPDDPPPGTRLTLIRHAATEWNEVGRFQGHLDSEISDIGNQQLTLLKNRFENTELDYLFSSDLPRAAKTGRELAKVTGAELFLDPRLRERNFGLFEGLTKEEIRLRFADKFDTFNETYGEKDIPNGESYSEFEFRIVRTAHHYLSQRGGKSTILVTHGGWIRCLTRLFLGMNYSSESRLSPKNTSITSFHRHETGWKMEVFGDSSHLCPFE